MTTSPSIVYTDQDGDVLTVWPAIPGIGDKPAVQIDSGRKHLVVEFNKEDAPAIAEAILEAAKKSD